MRWWSRGHRKNGPSSDGTIVFATEVCWGASMSLAREEILMAEDPVQVAPNIYRVLFENDRLRLLEVRERAGESSAMHSHPDYLVYALSGGNVKLTSAAGESVEVEVKTGEVMWREAEDHATENVGATDLHALFVELK